MVKVVNAQNERRFVILSYVGSRDGEILFLVERRSKVIE